MGVWGGMLNRSTGDALSKEEITKIYYDNDSKKKPIVTVEEDEYRGYKFMICTFGDYPILDIRVKSEKISIFSGYSLVVLKCDNGKHYELDRMTLSGDETKFIYEFNKDGDYIHSSSYDRCTEEGHKYSVQEVERYAKMFIDKIIENEGELVNHLE